MGFVKIVDKRAKKQVEAYYFLQLEKVIELKGIEDLKSLYIIG